MVNRQARRNGIWLAVIATLSTGAFAQDRGMRQQRIDVQSYLIDAKINPAEQSIEATALVRFTPLDDTSTVSFELNNALNLSKVIDDSGREVPASRMQQDMTVHLNLPQTLQRGKPAALTFIYDGKLTGNEDSPVFGIKFAAIHPDFAYLMYPARWFPVNDYTTNRFSSDLKITVPAGFKVVASDVPATETAPAGMTTYEIKFDQKSFPGSIAVVKGDGIPIVSGGITTTFYMQKSVDMAAPYGQEIARAMTYFTDLYGLPPKRNLNVVETEDGTPNGYSAPGILFFSPQALGKQVNLDLVADEVARQWWGGFVSPTTRNHMWIENGVARYSEILYEQQVKGTSAFENEIKDTYIQALTVDQPPLIQSARLEDYSPEYWAATAGKGAAVLNMLRSVIGDDNFFRVLKAVPEKYPWGNLNTDDFHKIAEDVSGQSLNWFFIEWIESSGAPEFKKEYTVFRTQKGFRVMGKITQDMDTFRMPVTLRIETEGNPEEKTVEVVGTSSEFSIDTFGKPRPNGVILDPKNVVLHFDDHVRIEVAIRRGEQFTAIGDYSEALKEYQKALDVSRTSSLALYRVGELFFLQQNWQSSADNFRQALNGDLDPKWTEVWSHIYLGKIFDISDQRDRALNEYRQALRTKDDTQGALEEAQKYMSQKFQRPRMTN